METRTFLVTGCAGFIGYHLCHKLLQEGHVVFGIDNLSGNYDPALKQQNLADLQTHSGFHFSQFDVCDLAKLNDFMTVSFDVVIHLASIPGVRTSLQQSNNYLQNNILSTDNLLTCMAQKGMKKFLFASSSTTYGNGEALPFIEDTSQMWPISPYGVSKASCEMLGYNYHLLEGMDIINLRLFSVYGPRQRPDLAIAKFFQLIDANQPITMYGNGDSMRDYSYISDVVDGFLAAIRYLFTNQDVFESVNIARSEPISLKTMINQVATTIGKPATIVQEARNAMDAQHTYANIDKAKKLFQFAPQVSLPEGLKLYWEWFQQQQTPIF